LYRSQLASNMLKIQTMINKNKHSDKCCLNGKRVGFTSN
jgi:hypothetical protein